MDHWNRRSFTEGVQTTWDATSVELAQTCPRKYYYSIIENIEPLHKSVHLIFGGIYASALELFYTRRALGEDIDTALCAAVRHAMIEGWAHERDTGGERIVGTGQPISFAHSAKTMPNLVRTIIWYVDQYGDETDSSIRTHHLQNGKPATELSFIVELGDGISYAGHLDRVVEWNEQGLYWMDQKTTGSTVSPSFFEGFKPSNQFLGYTWAGQIVLQSPLRGGIIDAAQIAVGFSRFERQPITFTKDQLEEWHDNTLWTIRQMQSLTLLDKFPMNLSSCGNYGGCPFRPLCSRSPSHRQTFIRGDYKHLDKPWDPAVPR